MAEDPKDSFKNKLQKFIKTYCKLTSLHGFKYITESPSYQSASNPRDESSLSFYMKYSVLIQGVFWLIICLTGFFFLIILLCIQWQDFTMTPVVTNIENTHYPTSKVSFPAVTICNLNKVYKPAMNKILSKLIEQGFEQKEVLEFFKSLQFLFNFKATVKPYHEITDALAQMGYTTEKLMFELSQPCEKLIVKCLWLGEDCANIGAIKTVSGFCCAFNYARKSYNGSLSNVREKTEDYTKYRLPGAGAGSSFSMNMLIDLQTDNYYTSTRPLYGAEAMIHQPIDYPEITIKVSLIQPGHEVSSFIIPSVIESSTNIRNFPIETRRCYFEDEVNNFSRGFEDYSYQTCITNCNVGKIVEMCGCVPFFYESTRSAPFCTLADVPCLYRYKNNQILQIDQSIGSCGCFPQCTDILYETTTQSLVMTTDEITFSPLINTTKYFQNYSILNLYYKDITCTKYLKRSFVSWHDLVAAFGGFFGLCVGGSVLSIIEFFYLIITSFCVRKNSIKKSFFQRNLIEVDNKFSIAPRVSSIEHLNNTLYWREMIPRSRRALH